MLCVIPHIRGNQWTHMLAGWARPPREQGWGEEIGNIQTVWYEYFLAFRRIANLTEAVLSRV